MKTGERFGGGSKGQEPKRGSGNREGRSDSGGNPYEAESNRSDSFDVESVHIHGSLVDAGTIRIQGSHDDVRTIHVHGSMLIGVRIPRKSDSLVMPLWMQ